MKANKKHIKINLEDILYFESLGDYVIVYTENKKVVTKNRISNLPENLPHQISLFKSTGSILYQYQK